MASRKAAFALPPLKESDRLSVSEFADLFGFPSAAVIAALERQRRNFTKPFYSIQDLAVRWGCSRASVYAVLRDSEFKVLDLARGGKKKGKKLVPASVAENIEKSRMRPLENAA